MNTYTTAFPVGEDAADYVISCMRGTTITRERGALVEIGEMGKREGHVTWKMRIEGMAEDEAMEVVEKVLEDCVREFDALSSLRKEG